MPPTPAKKDVALALLEKGSIFVHLDPRRDKVVVPKAFWVQSELVLQFGTQMRVPVPDLDIDDDGISGTLSFARRPFWVRVPWAAVFAIVGEDRRGAVWSQDAPPENKSITNEKAPEPKRSHLRAVPSPSDAPAELPATIASEPASASACSFCSTPFAEDATSCAVCGAPRAEDTSDRALAAAGEAADSAPQGDPSPATGATPAPASAPPVSAGEPSSDDPPPTPPPKRPHLRLVK